MPLTGASLFFALVLSVWAQNVRVTPGTRVRTNPYAASPQVRFSPRVNFAPSGVLTSGPALQHALPTPGIVPVPLTSVGPSVAVPMETITAAPAELSAPAAVSPSVRGLEKVVQGAFHGDAVSPSALLFDNAIPREAHPAVFGQDNTPAQPRAPPGARGVEVHTARTAKDIERLIPAGPNSYGLRDRLRNRISKIGPLRVYTYKDAFGSPFTALDLSQRPDLVNVLPDLQRHEVLLIRKIQSRTGDVQILIREDGKTPDLVVGGVVTEIKSLFTRDARTFAHLIDGANRQVLEHAQRHGLGHGSMAFDFPKDDAVPVDFVLRELERWSRMTRNSVLERVYVFSRSEMRTFVRSRDGGYNLGGEAIPLGPSEKAKSVERQEVGRVQFLAKRGRLAQAESDLNNISSRAGNEGKAAEALAEARELVEGERVVGKIRKLVKRRDSAAAEKVWNNFVRSHSHRAVNLIEPKVLAEISRLNPADHRGILSNNTARFVREVDGPPQLLKKNGIEATVTVYGSARLLPLDAAKKQYEKVLARVGDSPSSKEAKRELEDARHALELAPYYEEARKFGGLVSKGGGGRLAVVTGGGPGIMEAANRGALEAGGPSVGYNIKLTHEQGLNSYVTPGLSLEFENFATRKIALRHGAVALAFFPGGFGTMDELFEILTLMQTGKMERVPIVLVGQKGYWNKILDFKEFDAMGLISSEDLELFRFVETAEQAWSAIESSLNSP